MKQIRDLVPHQGAMCLLEQVLEWDENAIACRATSHRDPANPLRNADGLAAIMGVEYAAQAVAVHGGLTQELNKSRVGYLAALRDVACATERLDAESDDLVVRATRVAAESGRLLYDFRIESGGRELLKGRLSVVLVSD
ncbi:MAG TPA: 3-hydroxylacyl-ACP dehydratase [Burkholderiales bacterium]|nr:3-hydroxylacyl-ACP dehydratase [Burkholderiales bacterium]